MADQKSESLRDALGTELVELGATMPQLAVVGADTTESIKMNLFGQKYPERFFNVGIAEQNMIGISAGLALAGKTVFTGTYMVFMERALDQIRNTIGYCNLNVKLIGAHTGISVGPDGGSHQTIEDIAMMRAIPNFRVVVPADFYSTKALVKEAAETKGPFYIRLIRSNLPRLYDNNEEVRVGKANTVREGSDVAIIACGVMVNEAMKAAEDLAKEGISARVIDAYSIKPIDEDAIVRAANDTGRIITAEDHNKYGGLGSAVAEVLVRKKPTRMEMVAVNDKFGESGNAEELMPKYGISAAMILEKARKMVKQ